MVRIMRSFNSKYHHHGDNYQQRQWAKSRHKELKYQTNDKSDRPEQQESKKVALSVDASFSRKKEILQMGWVEKRLGTEARAGRTLPPPNYSRVVT